jgi:hypothetical protein
MGSYEIVIGKKDGKIQAEGKDFSGLLCLEFLGTLKLGVTIEEKIKAVEPHSARGHLVGQCVRSDDDGNRK